MSAPLLTLRGIEKRYASVTALGGIDLELSAGESIAILGPNGAGKSTLLRIIAGLAHPTSGTLEFAGGKHDRRRIGYLGHSTLLYPELSARENLIFTGRLYGLANPAARADQLLAEEGLTEVAGRRAGGFSRGMAQRLSIARARVHAPSLLLLDEPYTGLDEPAARRLTSRLQSLSAEGHALALVTHEISRAALLAERALILNAGSVAGRVAGQPLDEAELARAYARALECEA
ncbi:MAG: ABC transporter ATP-binding protein [Myxococcota bacterium]|nr:ABC transporter ATP-binding protein [Myxococcota bacterium]